MTPASSMQTSGPAVYPPAAPASPSQGASLPLASSPSPTQLPPTSQPQVSSPSPPPAPPASDMQQVFADILRAAEYSDNPDQVAQQLEAMAWAPTENLAHRQRLSDPTFVAFIDAWNEVALDPTMLQQSRSAVPFAILLAPMSQGFKNGIRDAIIPVIFKHMAVKRPASTPRAEFYLQAEAFAGLASVDVIPLDGAVTTLGKMLKDPGQRAAAITTLGKMVELCAYAFPTKVQPATLGTIQEALSLADSEEFQYDINYIKETMGWNVPPVGSSHNQQQSQPLTTLAISPLKTDSRLQPLASLPGHKDFIFSLAHDHVRRHVFTGGKDGSVFVWGDDGSQIQSFNFGDGLQVSSIDYHEGLGRAFVVAGPKGTNVPSATPVPYSISSLTASPQGYIFDNSLRKDNQTSGLCCLHETTGFITSESIPQPGGQSMPAVQFYDAGAGGSMSSLFPIQTFTGHSEFVTALGKLQTPGTFASGDKTGRLLLWDLRQPQSTGVLGDISNPKQNSPSPLAASNIITTLESVGQHALLCGSTDRSVRLWDVRMPGQIALSSVNVNQVVVRLAVAPGGKAAVVAGMPGLFILGLENEAAPTLVPTVPVWQDGRSPQMYHDVKWNGDGSVLFAGGKNNSLDMFAVVNT